MKFIAKLKNRVKSQEIRELIPKELTAVEINNAEIKWINSVQISSFETEMRYLTEGKRRTRTCQSRNLSHSLDCT